MLIGEAQKINIDRFNMPISNVTIKVVSKKNYGIQVCIKLFSQHYFHSMFSFKIFVGLPPAIEFDTSIILSKD